MSKQVTFRGKAYSFPDSFTNEQMQEAFTQILAKEQRAAETTPPEPAPEPVALPKQEVPRATVPFGFAEEQESLAEEALQKAVGEELEARTPTGLTQPVFEEEKAIETRLKRQQERQREAVVQPGREEAVAFTPGGGPFFRPTEVRDRLTFRLPAPLERAGEFVPLEDLPPGTDQTTLETRVERMIQDPETGQYRTPTGWDEFVESFANQPVLTEASARRQEQALAAEQRKRDKGYYGDTPFFDYPGSLMQQVFEQPDLEGRGAVETDLAAGLRSFLSYASAAAAEGYFTGLGYEVDERGFPVDPDDFGYALKEWRDQVGVPDVLGVSFDLPDVVRESEFGEALGLPERFGVAIPTPGVATERRTRKATSFDPEGRRSVDPITDDWKVRVAQNVAKGRTWGDELVDTPAARQWFLTNTGDPDHAYLSGLAIEVLMPAGPELLAGPIGFGAGAVADVSRLSAKAKQYKALRTAEKTLDSARTAEKAADLKLAKVEAAADRLRGTGAPLPVESLRAARAEQAIAAERAFDAVTEATALRKAVSGGFDPTLAAAVARRTGRAVGASDEQQAALRKLLKTKPKTAEDLEAAFIKAGFGDRTDAAMRLVAMNLPQDLVALTDDIAVPRHLLKESKEILKRNRQELFRYPDDTKAYLLRDAARKLPPSKARDQALRVAEDAIKMLSAEGTPGSIAKQLGLPLRPGGAVIRAKLPKPMKRAMDSAARALTKQADDGTDYVRLINERPPEDVFSSVGGPLQAKMKQYKSWDEVPADLRRQVIAITDIQSIDDYGKLARLTRDLTRAQMFFESAEKGIGNLVRNSTFFAAKPPGSGESVFTRLFREGASRARRLFGEGDDLSVSRMVARDLYDAIFDPQGLRALRLKAWMDPKLFRETALVAQSAKDIEQAAATVIREYGKRLNAVARMEGDYDKAVEVTMRRAMEPSFDPANPSLKAERADEAWTGIFDALYGGEVAKQLKTRIVSEADTRWKELGIDPETGTFTQYPTVDQVKALDSYYAQESLLPGVSGGLLGRLTSGEVDMAMIKLGIENGLKKEILENKNLTRRVRSFLPEEGTLFAGVPGFNFKIRSGDMPFNMGLAQPVPKKVMEERALSRMANPAAGDFDQLPDYFQGLVGPRYTAFAGDTVLAQQLQEGAESLFRMLEGVPVKQRGYIDRNILDTFLGRFRRNAIARVNNGFIIPRMIPFTKRLATTYLVPLTTIGVGPTLRAMGRQFTPDVLRRAMEQVRNRRVYGGGLEVPSGEYLSPRMLESMATEYGIGVTRLESSRVGSLAHDLRADARAASKQKGLDKGPTAEAYNALYNELDLTGAGYWTNLADGIERNFRKSVFEVALASGETPQNAAALARRSNFDYASTPGLLRDQVSKYYASTGLAYHAAANFIGKAVNSPYKLQALVRAHREQAKYHDPFNLHGDKAIKSLGIVKYGDDEYYLPENPIFIPIEYGIGAARRADQWIDGIRRAITENEDGLTQSIEGVEEALLGGFGQVLSLGADLAAPGANLGVQVLNAYDSFRGAGTPYQTQDVPDARPVTDEKVFWAMKLAANAADPYHEDGGAWKALNALFPHEQVVPPPELADPSDPTGKAWIGQPPEGIPHIMWEPGPGEFPRYYAFKPSDKALRRIGIMRGLDVAGLDRLVPLYSTSIEQSDEGSRLFVEGRLPETPGQAVSEIFLPRVTGGGRAAQVQQRELMRQIREDVEVESE